jgi:hypothetical protein
MHIEGYGFGRIKIDGSAYTKDVLLLPPRVLSPWWRREGHELVMADLGEVIAYAPETLVIGTGAHGLMKVLPETMEQLESADIKLEALPTEGACRRFAELFDQGRRVAGGFHLTC